MAGRRRLRAASASTVETIDEHSIEYMQEQQVIRPPAAGVPANDRPCFLLTEAVVYNKHGQMANLLHAELEGPFMIRGIMVVEPDQSSSLIRGFQRVRTMWIEISRTRAYSIGLKAESATPVLWATGQCAHFEIIPSERYSSIANTMFQGIIMHYNILDLYEEELEALNENAQADSKQKKRKFRLSDVELSLQEVLYKYAAAVGDGSTLEEATQRCKEQAGFLLSHFPKGTGFHTWLSGQVPDIVTRLKRKSSPSAEIVFAEPEIPAPKPASVRQKSSSMESRGSKPRDNTSTRKTRAGPATRKDSADSLNDEPRETRARSSKSRQLPPKPNDVRPELMDVDQHDFAQKSMTLPARAKSEVTSHAAETSDTALQALLEILHSTWNDALEAWKTGNKSRKHPNAMAVTSWQTKIYTSLSISDYASKAEVLQYHAPDLVDNLGPEWHESELYKWAKQNGNTKPKYEHITEQQILRIRKRQKKPTAKAPQSGKSTPAETGGKRPPKGRPSGKAAGLRPSLGGKKRPRSEDFDDDMELDDIIPHKKTAKTSQFFADGEDVADSSEDEDESDSAQEPLTRVIIQAEPLPSTDPKGPNQTWICEEPDCGYVVRSAEDTEGQDLIREHYDEHQQEASDEVKEQELSKVNLAMQEGSRGHLPINHLLEKIRKANTGKTIQINGRDVPQPITKSLLI